MYKVFIKIDEQNRITAVNSSAFLNDLTGWIEIDEGAGDKYHHAQGNYFSKPLFDIDGIANFGWDGEKIQIRLDAGKTEVKKYYQME